MTPISAIIITFNEEKNISRCIESLQGVADEIVVVDSLSTDSTQQICAQHGVRFISHAFEGYVKQKNWARLQASHQWVLSLDADEALSIELRNSIIEIKQNPTADGYTMNRLNNYCGTWIHHCGWYPDRKLRLWNNAKGEWMGENPHDRFEMPNTSIINHLKGDLLHYTYHTILQHLNQIYGYCCQRTLSERKKYFHFVTDFQTFIYISEKIHHKTWFYGWVQWLCYQCTFGVW